MSGAMESTEQLGEMFPVPKLPYPDVPPLVNKIVFAWEFCSCGNFVVWERTHSSVPVKST